MVIWWINRWDIFRSLDDDESSHKMVFDEISNVVNQPLESPKPDKGKLLVYVVLVL